jgi:hypothetical protein
MNVNLKDYISKKCPKCNANASRYDNICIECQVPLQTLFEENSLIQDLESFIQPIRSQKLKINRHQMLEDLFKEYPGLIPYAERIALINLARNLTKVHLNQINADVQDSLILSPQINAKLMHFQNWMKENMPALVKTEKLLSASLPSNPFLQVFQEYAKLYPRYLEALKSSRKPKPASFPNLFSMMKPGLLKPGLLKPGLPATPDESATKAAEHEKALAGIINVARKMGTALEHIRDLRQNIAHIRKQYSELAERNPRSAIDLDESIDEYNAVIQSIGELSMLVFQNGMPVQRNYTYAEAKQGILR